MAEEGGDLYERLIAAADAVYGVHAAARALHSKGTWCEGTFTATPAGSALCRAPHMSGEPTPVLARFSNAAGDPQGHDGMRDGRGMAVKLRPPGKEETDILATTAPSFVTRTLEDFLELMEARRPDPQTGQPDMEKVGAYLAAHPEALPAVQGAIGVEPPLSYATLAYHSPHAFRLLDADGKGTWVRYHWRPEGGEQHLPDEEAQARPRDYLTEELTHRLASGPAAFDLELQLATDAEDLTDPTAVWPGDREIVPAGRLELSAVVEDPEHEGHIEVFDPTRVADGIELSDDPILHARPRAYSVSAYRRLENQAEGRTGG